MSETSQQPERPSRHEIVHSTLAARSVPVTAKLVGVVVPPRVGGCRHCVGAADELSWLDSGADPAVVAKWIADTQAERAAADRALQAQHTVNPLTPEDVRQMVDAVEDKVRMLADADPGTKAALYASLGLTLTYEHDRRVVTVEARPEPSCANERVGGGT